MHAARLVGLLAVFLLSGTAAAVDQFVCIFGDRVKFDSAKLKNPTAKIVPSSERYTFIRETPDTATYIPSDGIAGKVFVHENGHVLTFIEDNRSSNLFVVTIFKGKKSLNHKAAFTLHGSPDDHPFFYPHTSLGECQHWEMTP